MQQSTADRHVFDSGIHVFDSGIQVFDEYLLDVQRARYAKCNVHEADEEALFLKLLEELPDSATYVDVGAAIGYYVILSLRSRPDLRVHAFEPLPEFRRACQRHLHLNGIEGRVSLHPEGVAARAGRRELKVQDFSSCLECPAPATSFLDRIKSAFRRGEPDPTKRLTIETIDLGEVVSRSQSKVDLLQMDIQGLEVEVLESSQDLLRRQIVRRFLVGTHGAAVHARCRELLLDGGYAIDHDEAAPPDQPDGILLARAKDLREG